MRDSHTKALSQSVFLSVLVSLWNVIFCGSSTVPIHQFAFWQEWLKIPDVFLTRPFYQGCISCELDGRNIPAFNSAFEEEEAVQYNNFVFRQLHYFSSLNPLLRTFDARNQLCRFQSIENVLKRFQKW